WCGCLAGALHEDEYREKLAAAGFRDVEVEVTRVLAGPGAEGWPATGTAGGDVPLTDVTGRFASAFIRARKPA
ncbi:MAG TPA: arsenite S-adenosylmethyltransferase, partial [Dehalococcoidia bacterium]